MGESVEVLLRKGIAQIEAGRPDLAHALYQKVIRLDPRNPDAWHLDGIAAFRAGNLQAAEKMISHAIQQSPHQSMFHVTLGNVLRAQARYVDALDVYATALECDATAANAYFNRATLLQELGRHEEALSDLGRLVSPTPDNQMNSPDVDQLRAISLLALGRREEAVEVYQSSLQQHPDHIGCRLGLAEILEAQANLEDSLRHARHVLSRFPGHWRASCLFAAISRRQGDATSALKQLQMVPLENLSLAVARRIHAELAMSHDRLGENEAAFREFETQNLIAEKQCSLTPVDKNIYLQSVLKLRRYFDSAVISDWCDLPTPPAWGKYPPIFLVGFPRSGTTLLDQILDAHPDVHVLEERPVLLALRNRLRELPQGYPASLATINVSLRDELRTLYHNQLQEAGASEVNRDADTMVINKLPLNLIHVGLIYRIFPEARLIFALRHPCDVLLSCFMQDFTLNNAMANFLSLADATRLYDAVLSLWSIYRSRFPFAVHELRYENLVANFDAEITRLLNFLDLPWKDEVRDFAAHARARPLIRTPSYEQVTGAIHDRSIGRWQRYRNWLEPHIPTLAPHISAFGYDV